LVGRVESMVGEEVGVALGWVDGTELGMEVGAVDGLAVDG